MTRPSVVRSIAIWGICAITAAVALTAALSALYPQLHFGALALVGMLTVFAVYSMRGFARRRGWAMESYAPPEK